jgi:hypothetical protein
VHEGLQDALQVIGGGGHGGRWVGFRRVLPYVHVLLRLRRRESNDPVGLGIEVALAVRMGVACDQAVKEAFYLTFV